jgi:hypothetical protein
MLTGLIIRPVVGSIPTRPTRPTRPGPPVACDLRKRLVMGRVLSAWLRGCARLGVAVCGWLRQMRGQVGGIRDR